MDGIDQVRLNKVINTILSGDKESLTRGEGLTTGYLHLMLQEILKGNDGKSYVYVGERTAEVRNTFKDFQHLLHDNKIGTTSRIVDLFIKIHNSGQTFRFMSVGQADDLKYWRGHSVYKCYMDNYAFNRGDLYINAYTSGAIVL
ncbi:hypothetical protein M0R04_07735 [Candidatus Dojkabacteria bacterium]|jgi:hypothetical protein|nr:hypothetical protein [Candidatus Dojkabacteria bacterium]